MTDPLPLVEFCNAVTLSASMCWICVSQAHDDDHHYYVRLDN